MRYHNNTDLNYQIHYLKILFLFTQCYSPAPVWSQNLAQNGTTSESETIQISKCKVEKKDVEDYSMFTDAGLWTHNSPTFTFYSVYPWANTALN